MHAIGKARKKLSAPSARPITSRAPGMGSPTDRRHAVSAKSIGAARHGQALAVRMALESAVRRRFAPVRASSVWRQRSSQFCAIALAGRTPESEQGAEAWLGLQVSAILTLRPGAATCREFPPNRHDYVELRGLRVNVRLGRMSKEFE